MHYACLKQMHKSHSNCSDLDELKQERTQKNYLGEAKFWICF